MMRKVRDYDAELRALGDKAKALNAKRVEQLGQIVAATGADLLAAETLAGVLLDAVRSKVAGATVAGRSNVAVFFQRRRGKKSGGDAAIDGAGAAAEPGGDAADRSGSAANG